MLVIHRLWVVMGVCSAGSCARPSGSATPGSAPARLGSTPALSFSATHEAAILGGPDTHLSNTVYIFVLFKAS